MQHRVARLADRSEHVPSSPRSESGVRSPNPPSWKLRTPPGASMDASSVRCSSRSRTASFTARYLRTMGWRSPVVNSSSAQSGPMSFVLNVYALRSAFMYACSAASTVLSSSSAAVNVR